MSDPERGGGQPRTGFEEELFNTEISDLIRDVDGDGARPVATVELSATAASMDKGLPARAAPKAYRARRGFPLWILWVLLSLASAAGGGFALWHYVVEPRLTAAPSGVSLGALGVRVDSVPPGATVWLSLGATPAQTHWVDSRRVHRLHIEHPNHEPRVIEVPPSAFSGGPEPRARIRIALAEAPAQPEEDRVGAGEEPERSGPGRGRIEIETTPPGALVWLEVGKTPDLAIEGPEPWERRRIRVELEGHESAMHTVRDRDFGAEGWATVRVRLPATIPPPDGGPGAL